MNTENRRQESGVMTSASTKSRFLNRQFRGLLLSPVSCLLFSVFCSYLFTIHDLRITTSSSVPTLRTSLLSHRWAGWAPATAQTMQNEANVTVFRSHGFVSLFHDKQRPEKNQRMESFSPD